MTSTDDDRDRMAQRLERMKNDFLVAQQRRRDRTPIVAARPDDTSDGLDLAVPVADRPPGVAAQ